MSADSDVFRLLPPEVWEFVSKITLNIPSLENKVNEIAIAASFPADQMKYVFALFVSYPLALLYSLLPYGNAKHVFNVVAGITLAQFVFGINWIHSLFSSLVAYVIMAALPPASKATPIIVFVFAMGYISASHMYSMYTNYLGWDLDHTGPQMILTIKLSSLAYNLYDGSKKQVAHLTAMKQEGRAQNATPAERARGRSAETKLAFAVGALPNPLEFLGYIYCFTSFFAGPAFEYSEYRDAVSGDKYKRRTGERGIPSNFFAGMKNLFIGIFCLAYYVAGSAHLRIDDIISPTRLEQPFLVRAGLVWATMIVVRGKYYFGWKVAEGSTVLAGYGFEGYAAGPNGKESPTPKGWAGVSNMDILGFELAENLREQSRAWNQGTQKWLERYVYSRFNNNTIVTYFVSAFWHGFYPGYYIFFMSVPLPTEVGRLLFKKVRPRFQGNRAAALFYDVVGRVLTSLSMNYLIGPFLLLDFNRAVALLGSFHYAGHLALLVSLILLMLLPDPPRSGSAKQVKAE